MKLGRVTFGVVVCSCLAAFALVNPLATAQDSAGGALPDDLNGKPAMLLLGGNREEGTVSLVQIGGETFMRVDKEKGPSRYVNLRHVTHIVPGS